jgi:hypothetical protein
MEEVSELSLPLVTILKENTGLTRNNKLAKIEVAFYQVDKVNISIMCSTENIAVVVV